MNIQLTEKDGLITISSKDLELKPKSSVYFCSNCELAVCIDSKDRFQSELKEVDLVYKLHNEHYKHKSDCKEILTHLGLTDSYAMLIGVDNFSLYEKVFSKKNNIFDEKT